MEMNSKLINEEYVNCRLFKDDVINMIKGINKFNTEFINKCFEYGFGRLNTFSSDFSFYENSHECWDKYSVRELYNFYITQK